MHQHRYIREPHLGSVVLTAAVLALVTACGGPATQTEADAATGQQSTQVDFPVTVSNCGTEVTFEQPPQQVMLLGRPGIAATLAKVGVLDRIVARAGVYPSVYYDEATYASIEQIPSLTEQLDSSGHLQISKEEIIAAEPDVVIGLPDGISRTSLAEGGIPVLEHPADCVTGSTGSDFDDIYTQLEMYGQIFDRPDEAAEAITDLRERVSAVRAAVDGSAAPTAAVLFPTVGGGSGFAYGALSMSHPQLEAAGLTNVFAATDERVFEVTTEEIINRDPDVLILLHSDGDPGPVKDAVLSLPGAENITAVRDDAILVQRFNFSEYPTPLTVTGLERIVDHFGTAQ